MHRVILISTLMLAAGCASGAQPEVAIRTRTAVNEVSAPSHTLTLQTTRTINYSSESLTASPDDVFRLLPQVYGDLGLPVTQIDPNTKVVAGVNQRVRRVGGKSMSTFFNCGGSYGNAASRDDVYLTARTQILPSPDGGTEARTEVDAQSKASTSSTRTQCGSTGELEKLIGAALRERAVGTKR
jgi:hypothetical protein